MAGITLKRKELIKAAFAKFDRIAQLKGLSKNEVYLDQLKAAGYETYIVFMPTAFFDTFVKRTRIHAIKVIETIVADHQSYMKIEVASKGISDLTTQEIERLINNKKEQEI